MIKELAELIIEFEVSLSMITTLFTLASCKRSLISVGKGVICALTALIISLAAGSFSVVSLASTAELVLVFSSTAAEDEVDEIEKLTISPAPDTTIRVRVYFEPLKERKVVDAPVVSVPARTGFTAVEWGGMVKMQPGSNFTCSQ